MSLTKLTKSQLVDLIEGYEENKFDNFKTIFGLPYQDEDDWIDYIKKLQDTNAQRLNEVNELTEKLSLQNTQLQDLIQGRPDDPTERAPR